MQTTTVYGIPIGDTVKKARVWLAGHGIACTFHDFKKQGVPPEKLTAWMAAAGWEKVLNRQGSTWRKLDAAAQGAVYDAESAVQLLAAQPSAIKRPVVEWPDGSITVGFDATAWQARAGI